jgi:hypothetical protein
VTPFRPVSEVRVRREGDALVVEHEGHAIRFRAVPVFEGDGIGFILSAENLYEEQYFATTFGGCGMMAGLKEWRLYDVKGKEKLIVRCLCEKGVEKVGDGYAVVYRPRLVAVFERPLSEGVVERLVEG